MSENLNYDHDLAQTRKLVTFMIDNEMDAEHVSEAIKEYEAYLVLKAAPRVLFFSQGVWWRDQDERMLRISTMEIRHARNLDPWLRRNYHKYLTHLLVAMKHRVLCMTDPDEDIYETIASLELEIEYPDVTKTELWKAVKARADQEGVDFWDTGDTPPPLKVLSSGAEDITRYPYDQDKD